MSEYDPSSYEGFYNRYLSYDPNETGLAEDDPLLEKYRGLYSSKDNTTADLLATHQAMRPSYDKTKVSFWDELGDVVGAMMTNNPRLADQTRNEKYQRAYDQWLDEGKYIKARDEEIGKDQARELAGVRYEIQNKVASNRQKIAQVQRDQDQAARMAASAQSAKDREQAAIDREEQRKVSNDIRNQGLELRKAEAERAKQAAIDRETANKERAAAREVELRAKAREITREQMFRNREAFGKYFEQITDSQGNPTYRIKPDLDLGTLTSIKLALKTMEEANFNKLKQGGLPE